MNVQKAPTKVVVAVSEMARMCELSRSRFYVLIESGVFPQPVQNASCKRPHYDYDLQARCLEIRQTGIGFNGLPVMFNRKGAPSIPRERIKPPSGPHVDLIEGLKSLGLAATVEQVGQAVKEMFPEGTEAKNQGEIIKALFLHLKRRK